MSGNQQPLEDNTGRLRMARTLRLLGTRQRKYFQKKMMSPGKAEGRELVKSQTDWTVNVCVQHMETVKLVQLNRSEQIRWYSSHGPCR